MKRLLSSTLALLVCFGTPIWAAPVQFDAEEQASINVYKTAGPAVVTVSTNRGSGAGSIVTPDGLVLTNEHVIKGANRVIIQTPQGKRFNGTVLAVDRRNDLALVKIQSRERFPTVPFATAEGIQVGQKVFAIGNPFGLSGTYTTGILSRIAQNGDLQTDAAINTGNSGGPLLNSRGELIGVNKAILSPGGTGNIGIGFATSALAAQNFVAKNKNLSSNPGLMARQVPPAAPRLGVSLDPTLVIQEIQPGSLAENLGLQPGDQLVGINGRRVSDPEQLRLFLSSRPTNAVLTIARNRRLANVQVEF